MLSTSNILNQTAEPNTPNFMSLLILSNFYIFNLGKWKAGEGK